MEQLKKLAELLHSINSKKEQINKLQKEIEIKISDLDKLLDNISKLKIESPDDSGTNAKIKPLYKTPKS